MNRRAFAVLAGGLIGFPRLLLAQPAKRVYRIAIFDDAGERIRTEGWTSFRKQLEQRGFVEGKNVEFVERYAGGTGDRLNALAAELVASKPDVIVTPGTTTARVLMRLTATIPIVFFGSSDPVGAGLVVSLSRPGGNATGFSILGTEISLKALELLRELAPGAQRLGFIADPASPMSIVAYSRLEERARGLKVSMQLFDGIGRTALERTFTTIQRERIQGLVVGGSGQLLNHRDAIIAFAAREKLPAVYVRREFVSAGGLASYDVDRATGRVRAAEYVERILKGARPAELPVEQASKTRLDINMKTARALGIKIPDSIRLRADEIIE